VTLEHYLTGKKGKTDMVNTVKDMVLNSDVSKMGIQCYQIDIPRKCKGLGGYSFTVGYSSDGTCNFPTVGSNGIDGTCQDFEVILY